MDSPIQRSERARLNDDDERDNTVWNSFRPLHIVLSVLVASLVLAALVVCSLPLLTPMGALMLHKLWDVLRFLVLTTSIGLGILNSGLWRGTYTEDDPVTEDTLTSKVPYAGVFYGEVQHSYSFSDKETEANEHAGLMSVNESKMDVAPGIDAATSTDREHDARLKGEHDARATAISDSYSGNEAKLRADDDNQPSTQPASSAVSTRRGTAYEREGFRANDSHRDKEDGAANEAVLVTPSLQKHHNVANVITRGENRVVRAYDDLGLPAVVQQPKQSRGSKITHRRGSSLEFSTARAGGASILESCASAPQAKLLSAEKAAFSTDVKAPVHVTRKETEPSGSNLATRRVEHSNREVGIPGAASKHVRSQSAYNLNELLVQQRPRTSKPSTFGSQLSKRRNVSLSCDLDKEYTKGGMPAWLASLPSPPAPPFIHGYDSRENRATCASVAETEQDESSLRRAFTESLAPWRAVTNTVPVNIPIYTHKEATQNKDPLIRTREKPMEDTPLSPSTTSTMGSPSPRELNKKVDAFIARFHERMRLQRLESMERSRQRGR